nr:hypothetical protein [Kibdelosporangium sp. MJ126-NF4]CTQ90872.1 hypothetical protein [Kibdelosporangium sp. MJ126-NF4]
MVAPMFTDEEVEALRRFPEIGREGANPPPTMAAEAAPANSCVTT